MRVVLLENGAHFNLFLMTEVLTELRDAVKIRIYEIQNIPKAISEKFTERVGNLISKFTIQKYTVRSIPNLERIL